MTRTHAHAAAFALALGVAAGCSLRADDGGEARAAPIREIERRAVGKAQAYPADVLTEADADRFAQSKKARRELGWRVLAKVLRPVPIASASGVSAEAGAATVPLFRTWLGGDELDRLFAKMYGDLGRERRVARDTPTPAEVSALFEWNATSLGSNSEADFLARLAKVTTPGAIDGLAGNARTSYSPGYVKKYLEDYAAIAGCDGNAFDLATPPTSDTNFTNCFSSELAADAAVAKASWRRNDDLVTDGLPVADTSAATLRGRLARTIDQGGWPQKDLPMAAAGPSDAYTVELSGGERYSLVGLHVITKELRHWVWVTVWWSANPDDDFGADRPAEIAERGAAWGHYKMNVVTDFDEKDPDPRGGFEGTLGDALEATHGPSTWCANPFLEKGDHNAGTNCIGCHQHAGDVASLPHVLNDDATFPQTGRARVRQSFPADYSWAFATPDSPDAKDRLARMIANRLRAYDRDDRATP